MPLPAILYLTQATVIWSQFARKAGEGVRESNAYCVLPEWLTNLFLFIIVKFEKLLYSPDLKLALIFLVTKVLQ